MSSLTIMSKKDHRKLKTTLLKHLREDVYCQLGISDIHGVGVFAIRAIPKGVNPFKGGRPYREISFSKKELPSLPYRVRRLIDRFCYSENGTFLIPEFGLNAMDIAFYVNHSRNPNVSFVKNGYLKTKRAVAAGEELTMNYDADFGGEHLF